MYEGAGGKDQQALLRLMEDLGCRLDCVATFREQAKEVQSQTNLIGEDLDVSLYLSLSRTPGRLLRAGQSRLVVTLSFKMQ